MPEVEAAHFESGEPLGVCLDIGGYTVGYLDRGTLVDSAAVENSTG